MKDLFDANIEPHLNWSILGVYIELTPVHQSIVFLSIVYPFNLFYADIYTANVYVYVYKSYV